METSESTPIEEGTSRPSSLPPVPASVTEVDAFAIDYDDDDADLIPADRRISTFGWIIAIAVCMIRLKYGLILIGLLLLFGKFPGINFKQLPRKAGSFLRKMRS